MIRRTITNRSLPVVLVLVLFWAAGCQTPVAQPIAPTPTPTATPTVAPTDTPTPTPTPTPSPSPSPTPTPTATPTVAPTETPTPKPPATPTPASFRWEWDEEQLTEIAQKQAREQADSPFDPDTVYVELEPGQMLVGGRAQLGFFAVDVEAVVELKLVDGKPIPEIVEIRAGGNPVPALLQNQIMAMVQPLLDQWKEAEVNFVIDSVEITKGTLVMEGHYR